MTEKKATDRGVPRGTKAQTSIVFKIKKSILIKSKKRHINQ
jgi:hypothetical protein|tara:strand:- start:552 stop:674 length:123 start_codon:yes stop_codon:yes gene_type:complete